MRSKRLASMALDLNRIVEETRTLRSLIGERFAMASSQAARDLKAVEDPNDQTALETAFVQGYKCVVAAEDLLGGAAECAAHAERGFSALTLLRGSTEASALAHWYLDPELDPSRRIARARSGFRGGLDDLSRFDNKAQPAWDPNLRSEVNSLREHFQGGGKLGRQGTKETLQAAIALAVGLHDAYAESAYDTLSNVAHIGPDSLQQMIGPGSQQQVEQRYHAATEWLIDYSTRLFEGAVTSASLLFGWNLIHWQGICVPAITRIGECVKEVRSERGYPGA